MAKWKCEMPQCTIERFQLGSAGLNLVSLAMNVALIQPMPMGGFMVTIKPGTKGK